MKKKTDNEIFRQNHIIPGIQLNICSKGNHPPKNKTVIKKLINNILAYSPRKNKAKVIAEYSTL